MNNYTQHSLVLALSLFFASDAQALIGPALTVGGSTTQTFQNSLQSYDFHKPSGTFIAGLFDAGDNVLCYASRPASPDTVPTFTGIAGNSILSNTSIGYLKVIQNPTNLSNFTTAFIVATTQFTNATTLCVLTATAQNNAPQTVLLRDATNSAVTGSIVALTGGLVSSTPCAFAAVTSNGFSGAIFTTNTNDGLSIATINPTTLTMTISCTPATNTAAQGVFAAGGNATSISGPGKVPLVYDELVEKLYVGLIGIRSGTSGGNAATSVAMYSIDTVTPQLNNIPMSGTSASGAAPLATVFTGNQIIGATSTQQFLYVTNLATMHSSTKPAGANMNYAYLIVNGKNSSTAISNLALRSNQVFALPLVVNNGTSTNNGKLADVTNPGVYPFDTPVTAANQLYLNTDPRALVGNGTLPLGNNNVPSLWVDGDAVYMSISSGGTATNNPGVWKSQAFFDERGVIAGWTDWEKITPLGYEATGNANRQSSVGYFAVDAYTGQIWATTNFRTNLFLTAWNNSTTPTAGLVGFINSNLSTGCFSVLDMNSSTTNWGANTSIRMALFGGLNTVCFAMTSSAMYGPTTTPILSFDNSATSSLTSTATTVLTDAYLNTLADYTATNTNIGLVTTGLPGRVNCLSYSGWSANNASNSTPGFFLAGTQPQDNADGGLYAYATSAGRGFNATTQITDLKGGFFATANANTWQELTNVPGTPVKIMSRGGALYVLTQSVDADGGRTDYIMRATLCDTVTNLNNSFRAIATSGSAPSGTNSSLASATRFYDFMISSTVGGTTAVPTGAEQLIMLTNDGIYTTTCADGTETDYGAATTDLSLQLNAGWTKVTGINTNIAMMVSESDRQRNPHTFWSSAFEPNANSPYYNSQVMAQLNSNYTGFTGAFALNPSATKTGVFNSDSTASFAKLPLLRSIYSDGSRRFMVYANNPQQHTLAALPYNIGTDNWNVIDPQAPIASSAFTSVTAYYWIAQIGSTGCLMVGTNNGVVSLQ